MTECPDTRSPWGTVCKTCGVLLPAKQGPLKSWMATRNNDERLSEAARKSMPSAHVFRLHRLTKKPRAA